MRRFLCIMIVLLMLFFVGCTKKVYRPIAVDVTTFDSQSGYSPYAQIEISYDRNTCRALCSQGDERWIMSYTYDGMGNVSRIEWKSAEAGSLFDAIDVVYQYEDGAMKEKTVSEQGRKTRFCYDNYGNVVMEEMYDTDSDMEFVTIYTYIYDSDGKILESIGSNGNCDEYTYDEEGRLIKKACIRDIGEDYCKEYVYDANGNVQSEVQTCGEEITTVSYVYDEAQNVIEMRIAQKSDLGIKELQIVAKYEEVGRGEVEKGAITPALEEFVDWL